MWGLGPLALLLLMLLLLLLGGEMAVSRRHVSQQAVTRERGRAWERELEGGLRETGENPLWTLLPLDFLP